MDETHLTDDKTVAKIGHPDFRCGPPVPNLCESERRVEPRRSLEINYSSGLAVVLGDMLLSRRSRKHSSLPVEPATEHGTGRTHGKSGMN